MAFARRRLRPETSRPVSSSLGEEGEVVEEFEGAGLMDHCAERERDVRVERRSGTMEWLRPMLG